MAQQNRINVVDDSGNVQSIPSSQLQDAQKQGYRVASQEETKVHFDQEKYGSGIVNPIAAAAAGAARGLSFGMSDIALTKGLGLVEPETLKGLETYQPAASIAGEAGAVLGSMFVPIAPAAGALGKAAQVATAPVRGLSKAAQAVGKGAVDLLPQATTAAGRIARVGTEMAIAGATEGAVYGVGRALTEHAMGDPADLGEAALAHAGLTALLGGALGGALGVTGAAGAESLAAIRKMFPEKPLPMGEGKLAVNKTPKGEAEVIVTAPEGTLERQMQESGIPQSKIDKITENRKLKPHDKEIVEAGNDLGVKTFEMQRSADHATVTMQEVLSQQPTAAGRALKSEIDDAFAIVNQKVDEVLDIGGEKLTVFQAGERAGQAIREKADELYAGVRSAYDKVAPSIDVPLNEKQGIKFYYELQKEAQKLGDVQSPFRKEVEAYAERILGSNTVGDIDKLITEIGNAATKARSPLNPDFEMAKTLTNLKDMVREYQDKVLTKVVGPEIVAEKRAARAAYKSFIETIGELAGGGRLGKIKSYGQLIEKLDSMAPEKLAEKLFDKKNFKSLKFMQENFSDVLDTLVKMKKSEIINKATEDGMISAKRVLGELDSSKISPEVQSLMFTPEQLKQLKAAKTWVEAMPDKVNPSGTQKATAWASITDRVTTNPQSIANIAISEIRDFVTSQRIQARVDDIHVISRMADSARKTMRKIQTGAKDVFADTGSIRGLAVQKAAEPFVHKEQQRLITQVNELNNNPELFLEKLEKETESINRSVPESTQFMNASVTRAVQYLAAAAPLTKNDYVLGKDFTPSKYELAVFGQRAKVINNPVSILQNLKNGTLVPAHVEAVSTVYPKLFQAMQREVLSAMADSQAKKKPISQDKKNMLSMFLNFDLTQSTTAQSIMQNQTMLNSSGQESNQADQSMVNGSIKTSAKGLDKLSSNSSALTYMQKSAQRLDRA
jgi:hypothetical protein